MLAKVFFYRFDAKGNMHNAPAPLQMDVENLQLVFFECCNLHTKFLPSMPWCDIYCCDSQGVFRFVGVFYAGSMNTRPVLSSEEVSPC